MVSVILPKLVGLSFGIWVIVIVTGLFQKNIRYTKPNLLSVFLWSFLLFYVLGLFWTNHLDIATKYIEYKLSLLLIPLLFVFQPKLSINRNKLFYGFILSVFVLGIYSFVHALFQPQINLNSLTSVYFSTIHHPTYFSAFSFFAMAMSVKILHAEKGFKGKLFWFLLVLFFIGFQLLCLSLAGLIILMLFILGYGIYLIKFKFGRIGLLGCIFMVPLVIYLSFQLVPGFKTQFEGSRLYFLEYLDNPTKFVKTKKTYLGGDETRLILWTATVQEIEKHPFGVGTGNLDDHLSAQLQHLTHFDMAEKKYNPHNQFFQTALEVGIPAAILLLGIIGWGIVQGFRNKEFLLVLLSFNLFINCLFESMLQRQSGIVFYTLWLMIFSVFVMSGSNQLNNSTKN